MKLICVSDICKWSICKWVQKWVYYNVAMILKTSDKERIFYRFSFKERNILESMHSWNHPIRLFYCAVYDKETVDNFREGTHTYTPHTSTGTFYMYITVCERVRGVAWDHRRKGGDDAEKRQRAFRLAHCSTAERQCRQLAVARQNR